MAEKYKVTIPSPAGVAGVNVYHGYTFTDGVAHNVTPGMGLDDFKDWGFLIEPEAPARTPKPLTDEEVEKVAKTVASAHKRARVKTDDTTSA